MAEIGLMPNEFYELSLYEWMLFIDRHNRNLERTKLDEEIKLHHTWELIAAIYNTVRDSKKKPEPYQRKDFIKLSFDKEEEKEEIKSVPLTPDEVTNRFN